MTRAREAGARRPPAREGAQTATPATAAPIPSQAYGEFSRRINDKGHARGQVFKAQLELTYGCNLRCLHCYTDCYNRPDLIKERELSTAQVIGVLDQLHELGVLWLCLTGGEIFMRRDFLEIYDYAKQRGFLITLFTNATLISERIADHLAAHPPFKIDISLHGATAETYDRVTQVPGSFERCMDAIRRLRDRGLPVDIKTSALSANRHELGTIREFVEGLGLPFRLATAIYPRLDGDLTPCGYRLSPEEIAALDVPDRARDEVDAPCAESGPPPFETPPDDRLYRCGCGTSDVHVSAWGELGTCTWQHSVRADLRETSVAAAIREVFPRVRAARYRSSSPCRDCHVYRLCDKDPSIAWAEARDAEHPVEHFCQTAFTRAERLAALRPGTPGANG